MAEKAPTTNWTRTNHLQREQAMATKKRAGKKKESIHQRRIRQLHTGYCWYLNGTISVLEAIQATFGVRTVLDKVAIEDLIRRMKTKYKRTK